mmetsp:Transcript_39943/g.40465  ORF Transcript_39943/g.40465 Transcript_39943/m.40465 type:complete len:81 (+) Transcript_39943:263-505(+)
MSVVKPKQVILTTVRQQSRLKRLLILRSLGHTHTDIADAIKDTNERRSQLSTTVQLQLTMPFVCWIVDKIHELQETMMGR